MNKAALIGAVAAKAALAKVETKKTVDAILETIEDAVKKGDKVVFVGFGTFSVVEKKARKGINPRTKEVINIPTRKAVKFKAGATFAEAVK